MISTWLQRHLEATGRWDTDGTHRRVSGRRCPTCHAYTLTGLDAPVCGWPVTVDPTPLNSLGELAAQLASRHTYALVFDAGRLVLDHRSQFHIAGTPADTHTRADILATHQCGHTWPAELVRPSVHQHRRIAPQEVTDVIPY